MKEEAKKFGFLLHPSSFILPFLIALVTGCASSGPEPVRLVLISPHREEIREEVAAAFKDWFAERTAQRQTDARRGLQTWIDRPQADHQAQAVAALDRFLSDWSPRDLGDVPAALDSWKKEPSVANGRALLAALDAWQSQPHPVELVWQDVGGGSSAIARYVNARYQATPDSIGIDVLFGGGTDIFVRFAKQNLLQPEPSLVYLINGRIPKDLNGVPMYDPEWRWFGPMLSSFGILCNREVLQRIGEPELPRSWPDLGKPGLRGWVNSGDPRLSGSVHMVFEIILQGEGWEDGCRLLLRLGGNTHTFLRDSGTLTRSVVTGEVAAAGNVDVNAMSAVGLHPKMMAFVLPQVHEKMVGGKLVRSGGTIINPDAIAVLRGAPRRQLARAFVEYTLSDAGQKLFMLLPGVPGGPRHYPLCRLSVVPALYKEFPPADRSVGDADPFTQRNALPYNSDIGNRRWDALNDLIGAVIVDPHPELAAAWKAVLESPMPAERRRELEEELFQPPCTEAELMAHARRIVENGPRARAAQVNQWGEEARQRYRRVCRQATGG